MTAHPVNPSTPLTFGRSGAKMVEETLKLTACYNSTISTRIKAHNSVKKTVETECLDCVNCVHCVRKKCDTGKLS